MTIWAGHRTGVARLCAAVPGRERLGGARNGKETGGRSTPQFDSAAPAHGYEARPGTAGMGEAGRGTAGYGAARLGWARHGTGRLAAAGVRGPSARARPGVARIGWGGQGMERVTSRVRGAAPRRSRTTGLGQVRRGVAGQGKEWLGAARSGTQWQRMAGRGRSRFGSVGRGEAGVFSNVSGATPGRPTQRGLARHGVARQGRARRGAARHGEARRLGGWQASGFEPSTSTQRGWAGHGSAGSGMARLGAAQALQGRARHGEGSGERQTSGFESRTPARGKAMPGPARLGEVGHGKVRQVLAWLGMARFGVAWQGRSLSTED
jgi:hypothetical protein